MSMSEEQEKLYQHTIRSLLVKVDRRDELIHQLRKEIMDFRKQKSNKEEDGCNGLGNNSENR